MLAVRGVYKDGRIKLDEEIDVASTTPVIVTFLEDMELQKEKTRKYRFADLAGKLEWEGDPVAQQRALRDEKLSSLSPFPPKL
jgi:hypothetical protein